MSHHVLVRFLELLIEFVDAVQVERRIGGIMRSETALSALVVQRGDWPPAQRVTASAITNATRRFLAAGAPSAAAREVREAIRLLLAERRIEPSEEIATALLRAVEMRSRGSPPSDKEVRAWNSLRVELLGAAARAQIV